MTTHTDPPTSSSKDAAEWDSEYDEHEERMWSGAPNGSLVTEIADLGPGRALDLGCGEGADAIWLASLGWTTTGIDISTVALERAAAAARHAGVDVTWTTADVITDPPAADAFDVVTFSYPSLRRAAGLAVLPALIAAIASGGRMIVLGHANVDPEFAAERGWDPTDYLSLDDIVDHAKDTLTVETDDIRPRPNPPEGAVHLEDRVVVLRRSS